MRLIPGDMQFVYNHAQLHDRTGYVDWPEPENRRHLFRLWLSMAGDRELPEPFQTALWVDYRRRSWWHHHLGHAPHD